MSSFEVIATSGAARRARLPLKHGLVETPAFMPVGTCGAVKGMPPAMPHESGARIIESALRACRHALNREHRFLSYGDAMRMERNELV